MNIDKAGRLLAALDLLTDATNPDFTIRQLRILLLIGATGEAGAQAPTLQKRTGSTQSAVSRTVKLLDKVSGYGFTENALDPHDMRARVIRITTKGERLLSRMLGEIDKG